VENKKKNKKVNHLSVKQCEEIMEKKGGVKECLYIQHVMERYNQLMVQKAFKK